MRNLIIMLGSCFLWTTKWRFKINAKEVLGIMQSASSILSLIILPSLNDIEINKISAKTIAKHLLLHSLRIDLSPFKKRRIMVISQESQKRRKNDQRINEATSRVRTRKESNVEDSKRETLDFSRENTKRLKQRRDAFRTKWKSRRRNSRCGHRGRGQK